MIKEIDLNLIESDLTFSWEEWLREEIKNLRTRFPDEEYWPDDYYERMEEAWKSGFREPILIEMDSNGIYRIKDGWHRVAICHKLKIKKIPVILEG